MDFNVRYSVSLLASMSWSGIPIFINRLEKTTSKSPKMSDFVKTDKNENQYGLWNVDNMSTQVDWFPIHLQSSGAVAGVVLLVVIFIIAWHLCTRESFASVYHTCRICRSSPQERELELADLKRNLPDLHPWDWEMWRTRAWTRR